MGLSVSVGVSDGSGVSVGGLGVGVSLGGGVAVGEAGSVALAAGCCAVPIAGRQAAISSVASAAAASSHPGQKRFFFTSMAVIISQGWFPIWLPMVNLRPKFRRMGLEKKMKKTKRWMLLAVFAGICLLVVLVALNWQVVGTKLANPLRRVLGVERVAQLETALFNVQDRFKQWQYDSGLAEPEAPAWVAADPGAGSPAETESVPLTPASLPVTATRAPAELPGSSDPPESAPSPTATPTQAPTPTPAGWVLAVVPPFGDLPGEGLWQPYLTNPAGETVAYRTFLQPDPARPYTLVAVAAFDLSQVNLHFVLGLKEPACPGGPHGYGLIPVEDKVAGKLLAAFNGGFIAEHGSYGAMADGVTALAGPAGLATLAIFNDGSVRLGVWGEDFYVDGDYRAWRQNALPIIHSGEINEKVYTGTEIEWGANLDGATVTMRSGVGLSADNRVLYYSAGPSLSMPALAEAMAAVGAYNAMLLDINPSHAYFCAMRVENGALVAEPLYPEVMDLWTDRYLRQWDQDFFYITTKE